jgi:dTDP-4-dehydrorhamnose reductase
VAPLNVYGRSKAEMEARVSRILPGALIVRTSAFFGPWDDSNFITQTLAALAEGRTVTAVDDEIVSPTYVVDLVHAVLDLLIDGESGVWHLANRGAITWAALARLAAELAGVTAGRVQSRPTYGLRRPARRPRYSVLGSERGALMPLLEDALQRFMQDREAPFTRVGSVSSGPARKQAEAAAHVMAQP